MKRKRLKHISNHCLNLKELLNVEMKQETPSYEESSRDFGPNKQTTHFLPFTFT